jgi:hypothetical protein
MQQFTTSSSIIVQTRLLQLLNMVQVPDEQIAREIEEYFEEHGQAGVGGFYYDRNGSPASAWIIDHNLQKYPQVTLIDDQGFEFEADISFNNLNQVTVMFAEPMSGKAVLT